MLAARSLWNQEAFRKNPEFFSKVPLKHSCPRWAAAAGNYLQLLWNLAKGQRWKCWRPSPSYRRSAVCSSQVAPLLRTATAAAVLTHCHFESLHCSADVTLWVAAVARLEELQEALFIHQQLWRAAGQGHRSMSRWREVSSRMCEWTYLARSTMKHPSPTLREEVNSFTPEIARPTWCCCCFVCIRINKQWPWPLCPSLTCVSWPPHSGISSSSSSFWDVWPSDLWRQLKLSQFSS